MVVKYMHHGDDLVEHRTHKVSFGAQCTNHSANSSDINICKYQSTKAFIMFNQNFMARGDYRPLDPTIKNRPSASEMLALDPK